MGKRKGRGGGGRNPPRKRGRMSTSKSSAAVQLDEIMSFVAGAGSAAPLTPSSLSPPEEEVAGPSGGAGGEGRVISRAEAIQLEAERIPSIKTSDWNPYTVFPKEIWMLIFDQLKDSPKDLANAINATPEWNDLYLSKRTTILFQDVLTILADKGPPTTTDKYLERNDYINSRLVCRSWSHSVENYLQLHPVHYELDPVRDEEDLRGPEATEPYPHQVWQELDQFGWVFPEQIDEQMQEMVVTHPPERNPFLTRRLTLHDLDMACPCCHPGERALEVSRRWWASVSALLERYGRHVWHCKINFSRNMSPLSWYVHIQQWISLMPNLKTLHIVYSIRGETNRRRNLIQLEDNIGINPLTDLGNLAFLKVSNIPALVFNELIRRATSLEKLQIRLNGRSGVRLSHYNLAQIQSDKLAEAYLTLVAAEDFLHMENTMTTWPLKTLYFHLEFENRDLGAYRRWPEWNRTFKMLEDKFGPTLKELKLRLPMATRAADKKKIVDSSVGYRLNLPVLRRLRVVVPNLSSFDFLLPMRDSLEELSLVVDHCDSGDKPAAGLKRKETLKISGNFSNLFKSNVWAQFAKLKLIDLFILREPTAPRDKDYCFFGYLRHTYDKKRNLHIDHEYARFSESFSRRQTRASATGWDNPCVIM